MNSLSQISIEKIKKEVFLELLNMSADFVYIKDKEHKLLYANNTYVQLTKNKNLEQIIGKTAFDLFPKEHATTYLEKEKKLIDEGREIEEFEEIYINNKNEICYVKTNLKPLFDENNNIIALLGISRDISEKKILKAMLKEYSDYDSSTGLYNKKMFLEQSKKLLDYCKREREEAIVFMISLNNFKQVSEKFGEKIADRVLKVVSHRLKKAFRSSDLICKSSLDEFIIYSISNDDKKVLEPIKKHIFESISKEIILDDNKITISCNMGYASFPNDGRDMEKLILAADKNMYSENRV